MIAAETKRNIHELITVETSTRIDEALDHAFHTYIQRTEGRVRTLVYDVIEKVLLYLIRQEVLGETIDIHISKYFEVGKTAEIFTNKLLFAIKNFMTPIKTYE